MKIKLLHILFILVLVGLVFTGCKEDSAGQNGANNGKVVEEKQLINEPRWVTSDAGLRIRERPVDGDKIGAIPYQGEVLLLEEIGDDVTISDATGKWSRIKYQDIEGWVFGGFLSSENPFEERTNTTIINMDLLLGSWKRDSVYQNNSKLPAQPLEKLLLNNNYFKFITYYDYGEETKDGIWTLNKNVITFTFNNKDEDIMVEIVKNEEKLLTFMLINKSSKDTILFKYTKE